MYVYRNNAAEFRLLFPFRFFEKWDYSINILFFNLLENRTPYG
jgi:hypothetical protein